MKRWDDRRVNTSTAILQAAWMEGYQPCGARTLKASTVPHPAVSVVVPVFNMAEKSYLMSLIASLKAQTLSSIEFLLVDDHSTDDSLQIMLSETAGDCRFAVISSEENGRQGAARNKGIDAARGSYIGFVDGDDVIDPGYFESLYRAAEGESADIAVAPFVITDEDLNVESPCIWAFSRNDASGDRKSQFGRLILHPAHVVCSLYSARLFREGCTRFPEGVFFEDNPTCLRLLCLANKVVPIPLTEEVPRYYYRQHSSSTDHRTDNLEVQIRDRVATADMALADAEASGYFYEFEEPIRLYYLRLCLINTASKVALLDSCEASRKRFRELRDYALGKCRISFKGPVFQGFPIKDKAIYRLACQAPGLYVAILRLRLAAKQGFDK